MNNPVDNYRKGDLRTLTVKDLSSYAEKHKSQLLAALPSHLNPDRMIRLSMTAFSQNAKLAKCDLRTIFGSIITASQLGLEIGISGQAYLVPYFNNKTRQLECQFIPGWQGIVDLVSRTGRATVWTGAVFEGDEFDYQLGDSPYIKHRPQGEDDPKKITHVYAVGRVNGSAWPVLEVWPISRVYKHRDKNNKVGESHYSFGNWEMYARKIPLLQVCKYMPKSIELTNALTMEAGYDTGRGVTFEGDFAVLNDDESSDSDESMGQGYESQPQAPVSPPPPAAEPRQTSNVKAPRTPASPPPPAPPAEEHAAPVASLSDVQAALESSRTLDALDEAADLIRYVANPVHRDTLNALYETRRVQLEPGEEVQATTGELPL